LTLFISHPLIICCADLSEAFNLAYSPEQDPENPNTEPGTSIWPKDLPGFKDKMYAHHTPMLQFARKMTKIFALALHLSEDYFDEYMKIPEQDYGSCTIQNRRPLLMIRTELVRTQILSVLLS
jgi:hypothetical protein